MSMGCEEHECCLGDNCAQTCWTIYDARLKVIERAIAGLDRNPEIELTSEGAALKAAIAQLQELQEPPRNLEISQ